MVDPSTTPNMDCTAVGRPAVLDGAHSALAQHGCSTGDQSHYLRAERLSMLAPGSEGRRPVGVLPRAPFVQRGPWCTARPRRRGAGCCARWSGLLVLRCRRGDVRRPSGKGRRTSEAT